jgi:hypothetical protein
MHGTGSYATHDGIMLSDGILRKKAPGRAGHRITYVRDPVVLQHLLGGQSLVGVHDQQLEKQVLG